MERLKKYLQPFLILVIVASVFFLAKQAEQPKIDDAINYDELSQQEKAYYKSLPENMPKFPTLYKSEGNIEARVVYNEPSLYGDIVVFDYGKGVRCFLIEGVNESCWDFNNNTPSGYTKEIALLLEQLKEDRNIEDVLTIGVGAGTLFKYLEETRGVNFNIEGAEINPKMPNIAEKYFGLSKDAVKGITVDDGRHFLETTDKKYDAIVLDLCYVNDANAHLWTEEFYRLAREHLKNPETGIIIASRGTVGTEDSRRLDHMISNSIREHFDNLYVVERDTQENQFDMAVYLASNKKVNIQNIQSPKLLEWEFDSSYGKTSDQKLGQMVDLFLPAAESIIEQTANSFGEEIFIQP